MNTPVKFILGAVATGCVAIGVAAQTGTLPVPGAGGSAGGQVGVQARQVVASPTPAAITRPSQSPSPAPSPSPVPAQAPASSQVVEEDAPPHKKKGDKHHGGD